MLTVPAELIRNRGQTEETSVQGARWLIDYVCGKLGLKDLSGARVLDVGCGVRLAQALINNNIPVREYFGVDVHKELIEYLQTHVSDPAFTFRRRRSQRHVQPGR